MIIPFFCLCAFMASAQVDSTALQGLGKEVIMSEVVIRSDLNVAKFLQRVKEDTSFYKAFRNLRILGFTSLNDIRMLDKRGKTRASLNSKTRQQRRQGCRTMEVLQETASGDFYDRQRQYNYYTAELYAGLFFTQGKICGENNIVAGRDREVQNKKGIEKHKEQLKMLFFDPGKKIPGIPFMGGKVDIFDADLARYYDYIIDAAAMDGQDCYVFKVVPRADLRSGERDKIVFDNITTWFDAKSMEIVARHYDLSYSTPIYDFRVHMEVKMTRFGDLLVPELLVYNGEWKVTFKKRERGVFTATLFDFEK